ncbi:hypothetical protein ABFS83_10G136000 [Erythranthe nasuta]
MLKRIECSRFFVMIHNFIIILVFLIYNCCDSDANKNVVGVGVVLDTNSNMGSMVDLCMRMAVSDFYAAHPNYTTRLNLHTKNAHTLLDANFAVLELVKQEEVSGLILGPQHGSKQEIFAAAIGETVCVPIVSFTARSSALSYEENRYFVRTALDEAVQAEALAAICKRFKWSEVVVLYEDTEYGHIFLSHATKAFDDVGIELAYTISISTSADDSRILKELNKLKNKPTRVFLVHVGPVLGSRLFAIANTAGMMKEGYAWVVTDSLSIFLDSVDSDARDSMEGVLGIRPYLFASENLKSFQERWKRNMLLDKATGPITELNIHCLWAYDAVTALAIAVENIQPVNSRSDVNTRKYETENTDFKISVLGPRLLRELSNTKFRGLAGDFELVDGKLKASAFEIFNIIGNGERKLGFWTLERGVVRELTAHGEPKNSTSTKELKNVLWPGNSFTRPKGRSILTTEYLRVGIPWKPGYIEFVDAEYFPGTKRVNATGFCIGIFLAALKVLPFSIEYDYYIYNDSLSSNWSYDSMLQKIPQEYDMVVADMTIWAPRAEYVDFALPYSESGVVLVVKNKKPFSMWTFITPFSWDLWVAIIVACILLRFALYASELQIADTSEELAVGPRVETPGMNHFYPIEFLVFPERNRVSNNWSVFILVCWGCMAFILMQSFTANLSAILTVDQLHFDFSDDYYVGYHTGSFMKKFLMEQLRISESKLRPYKSNEEFNDAMSKGSKNGGIDAIFDEIPYMKLFLNRYKSRYKIVGPTYRTGGMGFAFPIGSPLVSHFSKAILNVTQGPNMNSLELESFGPGYSSQDPLSSVISQGASGLTFHEFGGLFIITGTLIAVALIYSKRAAFWPPNVCPLWGPPSNEDSTHALVVEDDAVDIPNNTIEPVRHDHRVELSDLRDISVRGVYLYD